MAKQVIKPQPVVNPCCINQTVKTFLLAPETAPSSDSFLLMADGVSYILLSDGVSKIIIL